MAMRQGRTSGISSGLPKTMLVYRKFKPVSEWRQEQGSDLLLVYLPGFLKENIKVTTEARNILRIRGERLVGGNEWSRFKEDFHVPENCDMGGIRAKFDGEVLTVTMPLKIITATPLRGEVEEENEPPVLEKQDRAPPIITDRPSKSTTEEASVGPSTGAPGIMPNRPLVSDKLEEDDDAPRQEKQERPLGSQYSPTTTIEEKGDTNIKKPGTTHGKLEDVHDTPSLKEETRPQTTHQPSQTSVVEQPGGTSASVPHNKGTTTPNTERLEERIVDKETGFDDKDEKAKERTSVSNRVVDEYRNVAKGLAMGNNMNEERELLVNMGVAVIVILALGAYVSYTFGSSSETS